MSWSDFTVLQLKKILSQNSVILPSYAKRKADIVSVCESNLTNDLLIDYLSQIGISVPAEAPPPKNSRQSVPAEAPPPKNSRQSVPAEAPPPKNSRRILTENRSKSPKIRNHLNENHPPPTSEATVATQSPISAGQRTTGRRSRALTRKTMPAAKATIVDEDEEDTEPSERSASNSPPPIDSHAASELARREHIRRKSVSPGPAHYAVAPDSARRRRSRSSVPTRPTDNGEARNTRLGGFPILEQDRVSAKSFTTTDHPEPIDPNGNVVYWTISNEPVTPKTCTTSTAKVAYRKYLTPVVVALVICFILRYTQVFTKIPHCDSPFSTAEHPITTDCIPCPEHGICREGALDCIPKYRKEKFGGVWSCVKDTESYVVAQRYLRLVVKWLRGLEGQRLCGERESSLATREDIRLHLRTSVDPSSPEDTFATRASILFDELLPTVTLFVDAVDVDPLSQRIRTIRRSLSPSEVYYSVVGSKPIRCQIREAFWKGLCYLVVVALPMSFVAAWYKRRERLAKTRNIVANIITDHTRLLNGYASGPKIDDIMQEIRRSDPQNFASEELVQSLCNDLVRENSDLSKGCLAHDNRIPFYFNKETADKLKKGESSPSSHYYTKLQNGEGSPSAHYYYTNKYI